MSCSRTVSGVSSFAPETFFSGANARARSTSTTTAFDGTYTIRGLSPGSYAVGALVMLYTGFASGYYDSNVATTHYTATVGSATPVSVSP